MKVILTADVYKHGVAGEVIDVANGFARNYLIPQGMAIKATPGSLKRSAKLRAEADKRRKLRDSELQALAEKIEALTLAFPVKAGETGKLYGSVTSGHVSEAIETEMGISIDRRRIGDQPLRELGEHKVAVRLSASLSPEVTVLVHREGEAPESVLGVEPASEEEPEPTIFEEVMEETAPDSEEAPQGLEEASPAEEEVTPDSDTMETD